MKKSQIGHFLLKGYDHLAIRCSKGIEKIIKESGMTEDENRNVRMDVERLGCLSTNEILIDLEQLKVIHWLEILVEEYVLILKDVKELHVLFTLNK